MAGNYTDRIGDGGKCAEMKDRDVKKDPDDTHPDKDVQELTTESGSPPKRFDLIPLAGPDGHGPKVAADVKYRD